MTAEVEVRIENLRYSGKNYALTKALDCFCQMRYDCPYFFFFLAINVKLLFQGAVSASYPHPAREVWAVCESKALLVGSILGS